LTLKRESVFTLISFDAIEAKSLAQGTPKVSGVHDELLAAVEVAETLAGGETVKDKFAETELALESCTLTVKEKVPGEVGVPVMVPVAKSIVSPVGNDPPVGFQE